MNVWQMPESSKYLREDLVLDSGHLLDQVLKRSGILPRIVHKELGIISRTRCCLNSQKADVLLSVQRLHCPGVFSRAKDVENSRYTSMQMYYGADQQRLQILDLHFDKFPTPSTFACWKIRFKTEVCTCSQLIPYGSDAMDQRNGVG